MRIGIDATLLGSGAGGTDRYVRNVSRELAAIAPHDELILYAPAPINGDLLPATRRVRSVTVPLRADGGRARFAFSRTVANAHLDVMGTQSARHSCLARRSSSPYTTSTTSTTPISTRRAS